MADKPTSKSALVPGTLEMLILQSLELGPMHGYAVALHIEWLSKNVLRVEQGSLYPALERLLGKGWVTSEWRETPTRRRARYYTLTRTGRRKLGQELEKYDRVSAAIARVLRRA